MTLSTLLRLTKTACRKAALPLRPLSRLWGKYVTLLDKHPWKMQAINTSVLFGTGDVVAQLILEKRWHHPDYDKTRTLRFLGVGFFIFGPAMHVWYSSLARFVTGHRTIAALKMMLLDQCLFLPLYIASFIAIMAFLRRESGQEVLAKVRRDYWPVQLTGWKLWPAVQVVNFYFVPVHHRILLMNTVSLFYNTYLGWTAEQPEEELAL